jgi:hypothetical protein
MHRFPTEQTVLLIVQTSILLGLVLRIWLTGLFRTYRWFFGYLVVAFLQILPSPFLAYDSVTYLNYWLVTQALLTFFCALIVLELYALVLSDLTGLATASRHYFKICLGLAILGSLLLLLLERTPHTKLNTFLVIDRALLTSLVLFVLLLTTFLVYYPIPINRNLVVYSIGYAVYFIAKASVLLVLNISHTWGRQFGTVAVTASTLSMLFWLVGLSRQGEEMRLVIGHRWNREDQDRVLERLKAINASLLRTGKR